MFQVLDTAALLAALLGFVAFVALVHVAAVALAVRSRDDQLRHPRYWGR